MTTMTSEKKNKRPSRTRARDANNEGPCPAKSCKHPPADHRPLAKSLSFFCYDPACMTVCVPPPPRGIKIR